MLQWVYMQFFIYVVYTQLEGDTHKSFKKLRGEMVGASKALEDLDGKVQQVFTTIQELKETVTKKP